MFCAVTWSIFHVGWRVKWVSESKFCGQSNGYEKLLCMCSRTRENKKNKVKSDFWDTLYLEVSSSEYLTWLYEAEAGGDDGPPGLAAAAAALFPAAGQLQVQLHSAVTGERRSSRSRLQPCQRCFMCPNFRCSSCFKTWSRSPDCLS